MELSPASVSGFTLASYAIAVSLLLLITLWSVWRLRRSRHRVGRMRDL